MSLGQLAEVVWASLLSAVVVTTTYSLAVLGGARSAEARRAGRRGAATAYAALAIVMLCVFAGAVVFGVHVMLAKS